MPGPKYPDIRVKMVGEDGNVFAIIGRVREALKKAGMRLEAQDFLDAAEQCGSYEAVLGLVMEWVDVD